MRIAILALLIACTQAHAQSEQEILKFAAEGKALMEAGSLAPMDYYKELYRRVGMTSAVLYPHKAHYLRLLGRMIEAWEAVERGEITREKAQRLTIEAAAEGEEQSARDEAREKAASQARWEEMQRRGAERAQEAERAQQLQQQHREQMAAQEEMQRRAMLLQMMQNQPRYQPYQLPPPPMLGPRTTCRTYRVGNDVRTDCN